MDIQRFHRCQNCDLGQLMHPDIHCLECAPLMARFALLEKSELDLENGIINEGQYLEICETLKQR